MEGSASWIRTRLGRAALAVLKRIPLRPRQAIRDHREAEQSRGLVLLPVEVQTSVSITLSSSDEPSVPRSGPHGDG